MEMPIVTIDGMDYIGVLTIPTLNLELPILSEWSYPNLKKSPCRYTGSAYLDNFILLGHNYTTHFGRIKRLNPGDRLKFTDAVGNEFWYEVVDQEILKPTMVEDMQAGDWDLTLFTCTLGGRTRVTVRCDRVSE
jgi:sortase A